MKSIGKLVYSPRTHLSSSERWLVVMADDEISKYYRALFYREFPWLGKLTRPVWGTHISVIRGEKVPNHQLWRLDENKLIEFEYDGGVKDNGEYYWLKVTCPYLEDVRKKYGLYPQPQFGFSLNNWSHHTINRKDMLDNLEFNLNLIRHGESEVNVRPDEMGQDPDVKLTELGVKQAVALRSKFLVDKEEFDFVFSSSHTRALHTAMIASGLDKNQIIHSNDLGEYSAGDWTGKSRLGTITDDIRLRMAHLDNAFLPPSGESLHMVERRASQFIENHILYNQVMIEQYKRKGAPLNIALFSHGMTIKTLLHYVMGFDKTFTWKIDLNNTSVTELYFGKYGWRLHKVNDCSHYIFIVR